MRIKWPPNGLQSLLAIFFKKMKEASLEILYVDIRAYNKKLGFYVGCPNSNEALLSIVISFFFF